MQDMYGVIATSYIKRIVMNMDAFQSIQQAANPAQGEFKPHAAIVGI